MKELLFFLSIFLISISLFASDEYSVAFGWRINSQVEHTHCFLIEGETDKFSFVTTVLVDTMQNRVSIESPLGKALLGHKKGERVYIPVNAQYGYYVEIKEIDPFDEDVPLNEY